MISKEKLSRIMAKVEIIFAAILLLVMLFTCGMYIDIKMNGSKSSLPTMSEKDKISLLRTAVSENIVYNDDLIEPVFVGVKNNGSMIAACPDNTSRRSIEILVYEPLKKLFSGTAKELVFADNGERNTYIEALKAKENFMLIGFYDDLPSTVILPCISDKYDISATQNLFFVKNLFLLPDENGNLYAIAVSSDNAVYEMTPSETVAFGKILAESYDISDGYSYFEFEDSHEIRPVLSSSFMSARYKISNLAVENGKQKDSSWIENLFDVFVINSSLVKEFSSKNNTEINFIDDERELAVGDDGHVKLSTSGVSGIYLDEFLGFLPEGDAGYTFSDKVFAVKNIINRINNNSGSLIMYGITGVDYDKDNDVFVVFLKCFAEGIVVTDRSYDARFEIMNDSLVEAEFYSYTCQKLDDYSLVLPQKYAKVLSETDGENNTSVGAIYPMLVPADSADGTRKLEWVRIYPETEASGYGR